MKVLFVTDHKHLPHASGGSESSTHELCIELKKKGVDCAVLCHLHNKHDLIWFKNRLRSKLFSTPAPADRYKGYQVFRGWDAANSMESTISTYKPDVIIAQAGETACLANIAIRLGIPTVAYLRDPQFHMHGEAYETNSGINYIANSDYTAKHFFEEYNVLPTVITPLVIADRYRVSSTRSKVVFVNPVPDKGLSIALELAKACPEIPFQFVQSWSIPPQDLSELQQTISTITNIELKPRQHDVKAIYREAKILLCPSIWNEAWGRVVTEAHVSAIPVLSSDRGGLPDAVGDGGILLSPDAGISEWANALRSLWHDATRYEHYVERAQASSNRESIQTDYLIKKLIEKLKSISEPNQLEYDSV